MENFIPEIQGSARYRTGTRYIHNTRLNQHAVLIPFQFNDEQAYSVELTDEMMRFYRNESIIVEDADTITGATQADPVVITTSAAHGWSNGDEIAINSIVGMTELNAKFYLVANITATTAELTDIDGDDVDGTGFTAYSSGGTAEKIFEIASPYHEDDLYDLKFAQNADVMYITDPHGSDVRKLTRTDHNAWTLSTYTRTNDMHPSRAITGATQANPCVITAVAHGFSDGDVVAVHEIVGMVELNHNRYLVNNKTANTFEIQDLTGVDIDSTGFTAYSSGGVAGDPPHSVAFFEGRLIFGGSFNKPQTFWASRSPDSSGNPRYDDFTSGTDADHALTFTIAPSVTGEVDHIEWLAGTSEFLALGTFAGISKVSGGGINEPITPTSISVKPVTNSGAADMMPFSKGTMILYAQRGSLTVRSFEFDVLADDFISIDRNLVADHIFQSDSFIKQISFSKGRPDILWAARSDGILAGNSFKSKEDVSGWHRQIIGGTHTNFVVGVGTTKPKVLSVISITRPNNIDQTYMVVERKIGTGSGLTRRYVEFFTDEPEIPERDDFFTGAVNESTDQTTFENAMFEAQKNYIHLDSSLTFDGTVFGVNAGATLTAGATTGDGITFTASAAVFNSGDVGRQLWKKTIGGIGEGMAVITSFTSSTVVTCEIIEDFDTVDVMAAGNWYLTRGDVTNGLEHLEGAEVTVVIDGVVESSTRTVTDGGIDLSRESSIIHVGFAYTGLIKSMNVEGGGVTGVAQSKQRNLEKSEIRFLKSLQAKTGAHRYRMEEVNFD